MLSRYTAIKVLTASSAAKKGVKRGQMMLEVSGNCKTQPEKQLEHDQGDAHVLTCVVRQRCARTTSETSSSIAAGSTPSVSPLGKMSPTRKCVNDAPSMVTLEINVPNKAFRASQKPERISQMMLSRVRMAPVWQRVQQCVTATSGGDGGN